MVDLEVVELPENRFRYIFATFAGGARVPSWLLSDGSLRVMALTLLPYLSISHAIYFVEEPENGVHRKRWRLSISRSLRFTMGRSSAPPIRRCS
ncbi:MAG: hypothetical protein ACUVTG_15825 [Candidatus Oleimicrobiaceae bacterium]